MPHPNDLTRRRFLAASAGAVLAGEALAAAATGTADAARTEATPPPVPPPVPPTKRTLRKAVMIGMIGEGATVADKFAIARDCGFAGIEIDSPTSIPMDEIIAAAGKTGVVPHGAVNSAHWAHPLNHPAPATAAKGAAALETCLRDAAKVGASSILLVPGVVNGDLAYDQCWANSIAAITKALPLAAELKVVIAVENVWNGFLLSPMEAAAYVDHFKSPWLAFHFDIGNVINFGYPDQWIRILGRRIAKIHINDFSRSKRDKEGLWKGFDVELGNGDARWAQTMAALDAVGYSTDPAGRWATAEVRGGDRKRLQQISTQMDALFAM